MDQSKSIKPLFARQARLGDVPKMMSLLNLYVKQAEILPRKEADVYQSIREWMVVEDGGQIVGVGALVVLWEDIAEVRSLVVDPTCHSKGIGRKIVSALLAEAQSLDVPLVFGLTRQAGFFLKIGFSLTKIENLPRKVMKDCVFCPKFHACDEVAVIYRLPQKPMNGHSPKIVSLAESVV